MGQDDVGMSYQEKRALASMTGTVLIALGYVWYAVVHYQGTGIDWNTDYRAWARVFLYFIPVMIGFKILVHIIFVIVTKVATDEDEPGVADEMDKLVELKSERISQIFFGLGFLVAMISVVMGQTLAAMFSIIFVSCIASEVLGDLLQVFFYRRGV